jgi:hypothetical protein
MAIFSKLSTQNDKAVNESKMYCYTVDLNSREYSEPMMRKNRPLKRHREEAEGGVHLFSPEDAARLHFCFENAWLA